MVEVIEQTGFAQAVELESTLMNCVAVYNHHIPQRASAHLSTIQAMRNGNGIGRNSLSNALIAG